MTIHTMTVASLLIAGPAAAAAISTSRGAPKGSKVALRSDALPWASRPASLGASPTVAYAGDSGFDPAGLFGADPLAQGWDKDFYREAEIKHSRLAMLAALAFPVQEKLEPVLAKAFSLPDELLETAGRSPTILNGGLEQGEIPLTLLAFFAGGALVEKGFIEPLKAEQGDKYTLGDVGFDPLGLYGATPAEQQARQLQELQFGRLAMFAILAYVVEESVFGSSVLRETSAIVSELGNLRGLEADLASGVAGLEKGSTAAINELGNVRQLESDLATLSVKAEAFDKSAINELELDLKGSFLENVRK